MWSPPPAPPRPAPDRIPGALAGSLLFARPEHAAKVERLRQFLEPAGPVCLEVGFDHGMCILDRARRFPEVRQLGVELRARRVDAAAPHAPANCLLWHADARTVVGTLIPDARLDVVYVLFPTPTGRGRHLLFTEGFAADLSRVLRPGGVLHLATDVPGYAAHVRSLFADWSVAPPPPLGVELSRRERVCRRDAIPVVTLTLRRP